MSCRIPKRTLVIILGDTATLAEKELFEEQVSWNSCQTAVPCWWRPTARRVEILKETFGVGVTGKLLFQWQCLSKNGYQKNLECPFVQPFRSQAGPFPVAVPAG